jgi:hypothetical protein
MIITTNFRNIQKHCRRKTDSAWNGTHTVEKGSVMLVPKVV